MDARKPDVKMYIVAPELPWPVNSGDRRRIVSLTREFSEWYSIVLIAPHRIGEDSNEALLEEYLGVEVCSFPWNFPSKRASALNTILKRVPYHTNLFHPKWIRDRLMDGFFEDNSIVYCHFIHLAEQLVSYHGFLVVDQHNVDSDHWDSYAKHGSSISARLFSMINRELTRHLEHNVYQRADMVVAASQIDAHRTSTICPGCDVIVGPNGVDTEYFTPPNGIKPAGNGLVFFGSLQVQMNEDGILYFLDEIFPLIKENIPTTHVTIVGRNPSRRILDRQFPGAVQVLGEAPDVRIPIAEAAAVIVPVLYGGGTKLKTLEAMSMGKVVVSTEAGAQGLGVADNCEIMIASSPQEFADKTIKVLSDKTLAKALGENARKYVKAHFEWQKIAADIQNEMDARATYGQE